MYAQQLEMSGFDVIEAGNGEDALTHTVGALARRRADGSQSARCSTAGKRRGV